MSLKKFSLVGYSKYFSQKSLGRSRVNILTCYYQVNLVNQLGQFWCGDLMLNGYYYEVILQILSSMSNQFSLIIDRIAFYVKFRIDKQLLQNLFKPIPSKLLNNLSQMSQNPQHQHKHHQQLIANTILLSRQLFKTEFSPLVENYQQTRQLIQLKLKGQFSDVLNQFQRVQKKQSTIKDTSKTVIEKDQSTEMQIIKNLITPKTDHVAETFKNYQQNILPQLKTQLDQNNQQVAVQKTNKLQMNLAESTKMGTIRAGNIRKLIKPKWRPPFKLYRVIAGHQGWVRSVAVSPCNTFFATGSVDRTIKFWDLASGQLKISLTGHINTVRAVQFSQRHPYLFSCGEDKSVKCWDLEMNKVIRSYHGHLSGVYSLKLHEGLGVLVTGGRDSVARVWDIRVRRQIHALVGHAHTVGSVLTQQFQPYVITGGYDSFIKMWDIGMGKCVKTLTNHKKSIRAMVQNPFEYTFASASHDNIKVWKCPDGEFLRNISGHDSIIDAMAVNQDGVLATGGDDGTLKFWDWSSGYNYQDTISQPQPGSIAAQNGIFSLTFDRSGCRLLSGECDKTIKMWKEDETATEETHPIKEFKMEFDTR